MKGTKEKKEKELHRTEGQKDKRTKGHKDIRT